jgi:hypothetical protein
VQLDDRLAALVADLPVEHGTGYLEGADLEGADVDGRHGGLLVGSQHGGDPGDGGRTRRTVALEYGACG